jgi:MFS family permease
MQHASIGMGIIRVLIPSILTSIAGILGVVAALIVKKQHTAAGVLLIIGAVLCILSILYLFNIIFIIPIVLFVCGSIFAFKRERSDISPEPNMPTPPPNERKPGRALGIIAGSFAFLVSILIFILNIGTIAANHQSFENSNLSKALAVFLFMVPAIVNLLVGILGLTAALIMKKRHTAAGVMMIIGAFICMFGFFNVISMVLLVIGSVFALKPDRLAQVPPQPALPYISPEQLQPK